MRLFFMPLLLTLILVINIWLLPRYAEATGGPAAGAVSRGGEREPSRGEKHDLDSLPSNEYPTASQFVLTGVGICFGLEQEMRALKRACSALSKENDKLEVNICLLILFSSVPNWYVGHGMVSIGRNGL
jgi:hypothetical protein